MIEEIEEEEEEEEEVKLIVKAYYLKDGQPLRIDVLATNINYRIVRRKLEKERLKIIKILSIMKENEVIKSIRRPKNKKIQVYLNELILAKREIIKTIEKLKILFS